MQQQTSCWLLDPVLHMFFSSRGNAADVKPLRLAECLAVPRNTNSNLFVKGLDSSIDNKALHDTFSGSVRRWVDWQRDGKIIPNDSNDIQNPRNLEYETLV